MCIRDSPITISHSIKLYLLSLNPAAYCEECDLGLRHYPFSFLNIFFVIVVIAVSYTHLDVYKRQDVAHPVERHLAKVEVASSSLRCV